MDMTSSADANAAALSRLLAATAAGDRAAFANLYEHTSAKLFGVCVGMLRERGEAEDVLQEVFVTVWRRADRFDPGRARAMTWLITLTRNRCIDHLRKRRAVALDEHVAMNLPDTDPGPCGESEAGERRGRLGQCLDTLAGQQRHAIRAAFFTGVTYKELAARAGTPLATMKSRIRRGLIRLRACLEQLEANP